jgi:CubicO group peptidase (beta-lactamase class C family)
MPIRSLLVLIALAIPVAAQTAGPLDPPKDAAERVRKIFASYDHTDTPGCTVGVSVAGTEVFRGAWGMADLEQHVALTPSSLLESGSIAKQFTAAAVLLLAERGKLALSDPVRKYIPELPDYGTPITLEQLIHHTSGLRDWGQVAAIGGWPRTTRAYSNAWVLDITARQKALNYKPGDAWSYTNTGYNLLAIVVQRVSGQSLADFTRDNIFVPLGMKHTTWRDNFQRIVPDRAIAYDQTSDGLRQLMPFENTYGHGGLLTTVDDLLLWNNRFAKSAIGDASFLQTELEPARLSDGRALFYAAGLFLSEHNGLREISHSGATAGYSTWLGYYPGQQLSVALLCNRSDVFTTGLGHQVADVYLPSEKEAAKPEVALVADVEGVYESRHDHSALVIERKSGERKSGEQKNGEQKNGRLVAYSHRPLLPESSTVFRLVPEGSTYELTQDAAGKTIGIRVVSTGYESDTFDRVPRAAPTPSDLKAMTGDYVSDEAETTLTVVLTPTGLEMHQRPDTVYPLTPTFKDAFDSDLGGIRFLRDPSGHVTEMSMGSGRVWDLRLRRMAKH